MSKLTISDRTMFITCRKIILLELFKHRSSDYVKHKLFLLNQSNQNFIKKEMKDRNKNFIECKKESQIYILKLYQCINTILKDKNTNIEKIIDMDDSYLQQIITNLEKMMKGR